MKFLINVSYLCSLIFTLFYYAKAENLNYEFESNLIVPYLLPSLPKEICSVVYEPGLIILTGKSYFPYQIQGIPDVTWNHKEDTFYTFITLGAYQREVEYASTDAPTINNGTFQRLPENWWHHWVKINVYENELSSSGNVIQPCLDSFALQPNSTRKIVYAFVLYEQNGKIELELDGEDNSPKILLQKYFTPISNYEKIFKRSVPIAGNFFYVVPQKIVLDTSVVRRIRWKD